MEKVTYRGGCPTSKYECTKKLSLVLVKALKRKLLKVLTLINALKRKYKCTRKILKPHSPEKLRQEKLLKTMILLKALNINTADNMKSVILSGAYQWFLSKL